MRFNPKARLDTSRVRDVGSGGGRVRGSAGGGRAGSILMPGLRTGGGIGGVIVVVLIYVVLQVAGGGGSSSSTYDTSRMSGSNRYASCQTGADADGSADCARVAVENSLVDFWSTALTQQAGVAFTPERGVVTFTGSTSTGCGAASADTGPFYCPTDQTIYLDSSFFRDILQRQLGGPDGAFVEPYVLAHEYGHHIQDLLGTMGRVKTQQGPTSDSVRLELQADCYAGMWAKSASTTQDADGQVLVESITDQDITDAIAAATAVGDDTIEKQSGGRVNPEQWTHGSSAQRVHWFETGLDQGTLTACDTFGATTL